MAAYISVHHYCFRLRSANFVGSSAKRHAALRRQIFPGVALACNRSASWWTRPRGHGGAWRSNDAGRTWNPIFDSQSIGSIGAIAVAPSNPEVIYVGSGEADMRSNIAYGNGMYKSTDAGKTWSHIGLTDSRQIARILVDPTDPNKVLVAALGHAYGPNTERGVFRSTD